MSELRAGRGRFGCAIAEAAERRERKGLSENNAAAKRRDFSTALAVSRNRWIDRRDSHSGHIDDSILAYLFRNSARYHIMLKRGGVR